MGGHAEHQLVFKERVGVNRGESKVQMIKCYLIAAKQESKCQYHVISDYQ